MTREVVEFIKKRYPEGTRLKLETPIETTIPAGELATVLFVDDMGQIHVKWDTISSTLAIIPSEDVITVIRDV